MKLLLDSNIVAAAIKGRLPVVLKLSKLKPSDVAISAISRMEAEATLRGQPRMQARYSKLLREFLANVKVIGFDAAETQQAVSLSAYLQQTDEAIGAYDLLVAATALAHQLTLVTDRPQAFAAVPNLDIENWLREPSPTP